MPYIITTRNEQVGLSAQVRNMHGSFVVSRRAVATLEEARTLASRTVPMSATNTAYERALMLPDSGGTVGPLPDGTVIEVEQLAGEAGWIELANRALLNDTRRHDNAAILDAYNAGGAAT